MKRTRTLFLVLLIAIAAMTANAAPQPPKAKSATLKSFAPVQRSVARFAPVNFRQAAAREAKNPPADLGEIEDIEAPQPPPALGRKGVPIPQALSSRYASQSTPASGTGPSPGPTKTFKAEFLSSTSIPPDTMGAVGTDFVVSVTNDRMRIQTRDGVELSRMTLTSFWAGVTIKGATVAAFDPKIFWDRFNNRFILVSSGNGQGVNSGALFAVTQTGDPAGTWNRYSVVADSTSTATGGHWIDYPSMGHNKNWIVVNENVFNFGTAGSGYWGTQIYVLDKQAAYANTLGTIGVFEGDYNATCVTSASPETEVACGFTMAPAIVEDNTTDSEYLVEDWDNVAGQLRLSKITGTPSTPVLTVGIQFPQSANSWRFDAARIGTTNSCGGTCSGGYVPQRQQSANLPSGTRIMGNDSRIQNAVLRNGSLWCTHTVMLSATAQAAGVTIGNAGNPIDTHSGIQWWQIDPTIETGVAVAPLQRSRLEDATADNCHNGQGGTNAAGPRCTSTATQTGEFYAYPNISVNLNNDVLIGFTRFSPLTYPNSGYMLRLAGDPVNTMRDPVVFRPGQANYNIGGGSAAARQNRWGDYSATQTDPVNDTDFWAIQEYAGTVRDFGIGLAGNWETWWAQINPATTAPTTGTLLISEFRLRGPQGARDEFVELYNPAATPVIVSASDGSEGWGLGFNNGTTTTGVAVVPNGTVIPPHGHFLIADNPDGTNGPTVVYGLNGYPSTSPRTADSDTGWSLDLADNGGLAIFTTSIVANFAAGTEMDAVGFSTLPTALFKEGAGIPAVTATTPVGQMTFYRKLASGAPQDTGANENDFIFADPVIETLGVTPQLGAAGPENLDGPINGAGATTVAASPLDGAVGVSSYPNFVRDSTPGAVPATFGTMTIRTSLVNNTGLSLTALRYRVIDRSDPTVAGNADIRVTSVSTSTVTLTGGSMVSVSGSSPEQPPAQVIGSGLNSSIALAVSPATPLAAAATLNAQIALGVQVQGTYNFCVELEGFPSVTAPAQCFSGTTINTNPVITPSPVNVTEGVAAASASIATVSDAEQSAGTLGVTATSVPAGITITGITNTAGTITATVGATCGATAGVNNVTLQVTDSNGGVSTGTLVVNVTADVAPPTPTISGTNTTCAGTPVTLTASTTGAASYQWYFNTVAIGGQTASTLSASATGNYTVDATSNCSHTSSQSAPFTLTVNPIPATPTITPGGPTTFCAGGSVTLTSSSGTGNQWFLNGNPIGGATNQTYSATASGNYTVAVTTTGCTSAASAATTVTVNPTPATPTITPGGPTTFCAGGSVTLTSSSATGNQWSLNGNPIGGATNQTYIATAAGDYSVVVTTTGCPSAASATTTVTVNPNPNATVTAPATITSGTSGNASVADAGIGATYSWTVTGGSITAGAGTAAITFTAGAPGPLTISVTVTTAGGCSDTQSANGTITAASSPITVTSIAPVAGPTVGDTAITITGTGFAAGATVTLGGSAATSVVVVSSTTITARTPAHAAGAVNVVVTNTDTGTATLTNGYTYNAQRFDPNGDHTIDPSDIFYLVNYLFTHGPAPAGTAGLLSGDANGDNAVDPADIFYAVNFLYLGGPQPFAVNPRRTVTSDSAALFRGSVTLGAAVQRDGRFFVPVIVESRDGDAPQALSLSLRFRGDVQNVAMHHSTQQQPGFEISRRNGNEFSYLVAFTDRAPMLSANAKRAVVGELEVTSSDAVTIEINRDLTMLVDASGRQKATAGNGNLVVGGASIDRVNDPDAKPRLRN